MDKQAKLGIIQETLFRISDSTGNKKIHKVPELEMVNYLVESTECTNNTVIRKASG
jgi:hypothetical protein